MLCGCLSNANPALCNLHDKYIEVPLVHKDHVSSAARTRNTVYAGVRVRSPCGRADGTQ